MQETNNDNLINFDELHNEYETILKKHKTILKSVVADINAKCDKTNDNDFKIILKLAKKGCKGYINDAKRVDRVIKSISNFETACNLKSISIEKMTLVCDTYSQPNKWLNN